MDNKIPSLMQSYSKVSSTLAPSLKVKLKSRSLEKTSSVSSSSHENASQTVHRRRKAKTKSRSMNKLSLKKCLPDSQTAQCNNLSHKLFPLRDTRYSSSIHSNGNSDTSKLKFHKKTLKQHSSFDKFNKQDVISKKLLFTDFLQNEKKNSSTEIKDKNVLENDHTKFVSESLFSEWKEYNKAEQNEIRKLSTYNTTQVESISQDKMGNFFSSNELKPGDQKSAIEKSPRLFKKKKKKSFSKQSPNIFSSSSSEYSFSPNSEKNSKNKERSDFQFGSGMPYQSEINPSEAYKDLSYKKINDNQNSYLKWNSENKFEASKRKPFSFINTGNHTNFSETSKIYNSKELNNDQNSCLKWNSDDKLQAPIINPISFINTKKQAKKDDQSEFSLKLTPDVLKRGLTSDNLFSSHQSMPKIGKENLLDFAKFADIKSEHGKTVMDSKISSDIVSQCSKRPDMYLGDCCQAVNWTVLPQTSRFSENPYIKKCSCSCSSSCTCQESFCPFSSSLNSSRHVQVIKLPEGTCEKHGLSKTVELLEVVSLEDIMEG